MDEAELTSEDLDRRGSRKRRFGTVFLILGFAAAAAAVILTINNFKDDIEAGKSALADLHRMEEMLGTLTGSGNADVFMGGKHYTAVWNRDTPKDRTVFYGEDGEEISLLPGKTMIFLVDYQNDLRQVSYE